MSRNNNNMREIKIHVPEGWEAETVNGEIFLKAVVKYAPELRPITERVKTLNDAIGVIGEHDEQVSEYRLLCAGALKNQHVGAYQALVIITKALNEGWTPNYESDWRPGFTSDEKYFPCFGMNGEFRFDVASYTRTVSSVSSRLCFKSRELAEYAGRTFTDLYQKFMMV